MWASWIIAPKAWGLHIFAVDWVAPPGIAPIIISGNVAMDKPASRCRMSRRSSDEVQKLAKLSDKAARHAARLVSTDRDFSHGHPCKKDKGSTRHNWEREAAHLKMADTRIKEARERIQRQSQSLTQSASDPILITHLADFSVQEVNFEHIF